MKEWILEQVRKHGFCRLDRHLLNKVFPGKEKVQIRQLHHFCHEHRLKWRSFPKLDIFEFRPKGDTELVRGHG